MRGPGSGGGLLRPVHGRGIGGLATVLALAIAAVAGCSGGQVTPVPSAAVAAATPPPSPVSAPTATETATILVARTATPAGAGLFTPAGSMDATRVNATLLRDGRVLMVGGNDDSDNALASALLFDPRSGAYSRVAGTLASARLDPAVVELQDGRVLVVGGEDGDQAPLPRPSCSTRAQEPSRQRAH
jgi:hypothetical protein